MSINNQTRKTLLVSFTGVNAGDTITLTDLGDIISPDTSSGSYTNLTSIQDDIIIIRKFTGNFLNSGGVDSGYGPTANEAWEAWTYPYTETDGVTSSTNGSIMYEIDEDSTKNNLILTFTDQDLYFYRENGAMVLLPPILPTDVFYIIRKTKSDNKLVTFVPSARITANNLNTALDQNFFLGQEAEMWFQNFHKISPAIGQPGGIPHLDEDGLLHTKYITGRQLSRSDEVGANWNALSRTIENLPDPIANDQAVNKQYVDNIEQYGGTLTPQQVSFTITSSNAGEDQTYTYGTDYTDVETWAQTDEEFFIVSIDGIIQIPDVDFTIPSTTTIKIIGDTNEGDVINVRNIGRTGANTVGTATVTSTGSTAGRVLAARFAERYNILDFAVDGYSPGTLTTGIADDAAPTWNAAIDGIAAAGGGTMFIPRGHYHFTTRPKEVTGCINIEGEGPCSCLVKRYNEDGTGIYSGAEGVYRGLISFEGNTNNNSYIKRLSILNYEDGSESGEDALHPGNGSAISIVADDTEDDYGPQQIWIDDIQCSAEETSGVAYKHWKCGILIDGSKQINSVSNGVCGVYINGCTFSANADAAIKGVAVKDLFIQGCVADKGRTIDAAGNRTAVGLKLEGGLYVETVRPIIMNCDFSASYGIEIGAEPDASLVRAPHFYGNMGIINLGENVSFPMMVGTQDGTRTVHNSLNEQYTLLTNGFGSTPHSHIYGGLRLRGQGLTVGNVESGGDIYLPSEGDMALYGKLEISESTAPTGNSPAETVRLYADSSDGKLYARFDEGDYPIPLADNRGNSIVVLTNTMLLEDQPAGLSYWILGTDDENIKHPQAPETVAGETWWLIDNYNSTDHPQARYPVARGWNLWAGGWTRTQYSGRVNEQYADGTQAGDPIEWLLTSGGPAETYNVENVSPTRTYDASAAEAAGDLAALKSVVAVLADVLGTLIDDLRAHGITKV